MEEILNERDSEGIDVKITTDAKKAEIAGYNIKRERAFLKKSKPGRRLKVLLILLIAAIILGIFQLMYPIAERQMTPIIEVIDEVGKVFISVEQSNENYKSGTDALNAGNFSQAILYLRGVIREDDQYQSAQEKLELALIYKASGDNFQEGSSAMEEKDWITALNLLSAIPPIAPEYKDAQLHLETVNAMLISAENFKKGMEFFEVDQLDKAQLLLEHVIESDPNYALAQITIEEINLARATYYLSQARRKIDGGDFSGASTDLSEAQFYGARVALSAEFEDQIEETIWDLILSDLKTDARRYTYDELMENAAFLSGEKINIRGRVVGKSEDSSIVVYLNMTKRGEVWTDRVAVYYHDAEELTQGEILNVYGTINGFYNLSPTRVIPAIGAVFIE